MSGSEYPTLGMAIPTYFSVTQHTKSAISANTGFRSTHTMNFAKSVLLKLTEYDGNVNNKITRIATALDPRVKSFLPALSITQASIEEEIRMEFDYTDQSIYDAEQGRSASTSASSSSAKPSATATDMSSLMAALQVPSGPVQGSSWETLESELKRWFAHQPMSMQQSSREVCMWFQVNKQLYPRIEVMARDYVGVASTSVPSEAAFSRAGAAIRKRRARLDDNAVSAICELQSFLAFNQHQQ
jgi:hAT family C-terminal dimerisation region